MLSVPERQQEARLQSILQSCLNFDVSFNKTRKIQDLLKSLLNTDVNIRKDLSRKVSINIVAPIDKVYEVFLKAPIEKQNKENTRKMIMLLAIGKFARLMTKQFNELNYNEAMHDIETDILEINKDFLIKM